MQSHSIDLEPSSSPTALDSTSDDVSAPAVSDRVVSSSGVVPSPLPKKRPRKCVLRSNARCHSRGIGSGGCHSRGSDGATRKRSRGSGSGGCHSRGSDAAKRPLRVHGSVGSMMLLSHRVFRRSRSPAIFQRCSSLSSVSGDSMCGAADDDDDAAITSKAIVKGSRLASPQLGHGFENGKLTTTIVSTRAVRGMLDGIFEI